MKTQPKVTQKITKHQITMDVYEIFPMNVAFGLPMFMLRVSVRNSFVISFRLDFNPSSIELSGRRNESIEMLQRTLKFSIENDVNCVNIEIHQMEELHMSLSRTVILRHHWIDEFIRSITNASKSFIR